MKLSSQDKGGLLAAANVIAVAAFAAIVGTSEPVLAAYTAMSQFALLVGATLLPALLVGALLGRIGASMIAPAMARRILIATLALSAVVAFGAIAGMTWLIPFAVPSTLACAILLARWTRPRGHVYASRIRFV